MKKVVMILAQGFEEIEAITLIDILRRVDIKVVVASLKDQEVVGSHEIIIKTDILIHEINADEFDMILLPGGLPNAEILANHEQVKALLKKFDAKNKLIGAICAAPLALAKAGVLKKHYTCYPGFEKAIAHEGYDDKQNVVIDENIFTSRGPATAFEFALQIVKKLVLPQKYENLKGELLIN